MQLQHNPPAQQPVRKISTFNNRKPLCSHNAGAVVAVLAAAVAIVAAEDSAAEVASEVAVIAAAHFAAVALIAIEVSADTGVIVDIADTVTEAIDTGAHIVIGTDTGIGIDTGTDIGIVTLIAIVIGIVTVSHLPGIVIATITTPTTRCFIPAGGSGDLIPTITTVASDAVFTADATDVGFADGCVTSLTKTVYSEAIHKLTCGLIASLRSQL